MMHDIARTAVSDFTEDTVAIDASRELEAQRETNLFEACPSAFWLAPDRSDVLPHVTGPALPRPHQILQASARPKEEPAEVAISGRGIGMASAMLAAGPLFTSLLFLAVPDMGSSSWQRIAAALIVPLVTLPINAIVGALLGWVPITLGVMGLGWLGRRFVRARERWLWSVTGGGMGLAIAGLFDAGEWARYPC